MSQLAGKVFFMAETVSFGNAMCAGPAWPGQAGGWQAHWQPEVSEMVRARAAAWLLSHPKRSAAAQPAPAPSKRSVRSHTSRLAPS